MVSMDLVALKVAFMVKAMVLLLKISLISIMILKACSLSLTWKKTLTVLNRRKVYSDFSSEWSQAPMTSSLITSLLWFSLQF